MYFINLPHTGTSSYILQPHKQLENFLNFNYKDKTKYIPKKDYDDRNVMQQHYFNVYIVVQEGFREKIVCICLFTVYLKIQSVTQAKPT
jgi:hypothetical protein